MTSIEVRTDHEAVVMDWDGKCFKVMFQGRGNEDTLAPKAHKETRRKAVRNGRPLTTFRLMSIDGVKVSYEFAYS